MDLVFSGTTQLAAAIRAGHVSATEVLEAHLAQIERHNPALNAIITLDAERAQARAREADDALARRDQSILAWEQFFQSWDALLCPASMVTAFPHCETGAPLRVDGLDVAYWLVSAHGTVFNYTGHPAVVLPYRLDRDGLPNGVQLVGKRWDESRLLAMARALSHVTGEFRRPPGYERPHTSRFAGSRRSCETPCSVK